MLSALNHNQFGEIETFSDSIEMARSDSRKIGQQCVHFFFPFCIQTAFLEETCPPISRNECALTPSLLSSCVKRMFEQKM